MYVLDSQIANFFANFWNEYKSSVVNFELEQVAGIGHACIYISNKHLGTFNNVIG